jgi:hypothetical protein
MYVHVAGEATHIAILEGRSLIEHYVSRPADDVFQIHGNIYVGKVENVLPGMEAAFVDIATPKSAVLYRSDVQYDPDDVETPGSQPRIEDVLRPRQLITCQVTRVPGSPRRSRSRVDSSCWFRTRRPTGSPSGSPTASASGSVRSWIGFGRRVTESSSARPPRT